MLKTYTKQKTVRNKKYLAWIRKLPCGYEGHNCFGQIEAHHVRRQRWNAGTGHKPHDLVAVPRCQFHHDPRFEDNIELEIIALLIRYLGEKK